MKAFCKIFVSLSLLVATATASAAKILPFFSSSPAVSSSLTGLLSKKLPVLPVPVRLDAEKPWKSTLARSVLDVPRGGGPILQPETAAKAFLTIFGLNCIHGILFPKAHVSFYGMKPDTFVCFLVREITGCGSNIALLLYLQYFQGMAFEQALGWSCFPYMAQVILKLATGVFEEFNVPYGSSPFLILALNGATSYASLANASFAKGLVKFYGIASLINGTLMFWKPEEFSGDCKVPFPNGTQIFLLGTYGMYLVAHFSVLLQAFGMEKNRATGWATVVLAAGLLGLIAKGSFHDAGAPIEPALAWILLLSIFAQSLLLQ